MTHNASLGDHKYVVMRITLDLDKVSEPPVQCSPYWKLNTSILSDEDFLANFSTMYQNLQLKIAQYQDIACWWDLCAKPAIRKFCMGVSSKLANVRKDTKRFLFFLS